MCLFSYSCVCVCVCVWRQRRVNIDSSSSPVSQSVGKVHPHFFNLCIYKCDLRAAVGGTLSIFVPQKWDVLCAPTQTASFMYCSQRGLLIFCWMYSQKGSHGCRRNVTMNRLILLFLLLRSWMLLDSRVYRDKMIRLEKVSSAHVQVTIQGLIFPVKALIYLTWQ